LSFRSIQSGWNSAATPLTDHGLNGAGQIVAVLDTGVDYDSCYFAETDGSRPPANTGTPLGGLAWTNIDPSRRKIIAYDFLYSCDQYPNARGRENPNDPSAYDNNEDGTHAAALVVGDVDRLGEHGYVDGTAPARKLIVQVRRRTGACCAEPPGL